MSVAFYFINLTHHREVKVKVRVSLSKVIVYES